MKDNNKLKNNKTRTVKDTMGNIKVPLNAEYAAQTQRAVNNFTVSNQKFTSDFIYPVVIIKLEAAKTNYKLKLINKDVCNAIVKACKEILNSKYDNQFPVDVYQTGSGTSTNMNVNEVISSIANKIIKNKSIKIHPNDHVNLGQSSNDVIPAAISVSASLLIEKSLIPALDEMQKTLNNKSNDFKDIIKIGRTHLQDATPITLGQEFSGYEDLIKKSINRINSSKKMLRKLALGGTAVGTGLNTHPQFGKIIAENISSFTSVAFEETSNHFSSQSSQDNIVEFSGSLKTLAVNLNKIANDIRWLGSGPRSGLGELIIPPVQPGSSIMPGKVNPVIAESLIQVCSQVIANDTAITLGGLGSVLELNLMLPLIAHNLLFSINILSNSIKMFNDKLLINLKANEEKCLSYIEGSLAMCTSLVPEIGYEMAAKIAYEAHKTGKTVKEIALSKKILSKEKIDLILDPKTMLKPK